jgi:hypothetical protein
VSGPSPTITVGAEAATYSLTHRDQRTTEDFRWSADVSADDEVAVFLTSRSRDMADDEGNVYGVLRTADGQVRSLGVWNQQVAVFSHTSAAGPWSGHPLLPLNDDALAGRRQGKSRPPKEVFRKMEIENLLTPLQRKRMMKGCHV